MIALAVAAIAVALQGIANGVGAPQGTAPPQGPAAKTGIIRGRILRPDGRPLARAHVRLVPSLGGSDAYQALGGPRAAETDVDGTYEFTELNAGSYTLSAAKAGYVTLEFSQRRAFSRGQAIKLAEGETRERVDLVLPRPGAILGRIVDEGGDPVEGASVRVLHMKYVAGRRQLVDVPGAAAQRTNDLGRYRIYGLQPGRYFVCSVVGQLVLAAPAVVDVPGYAMTYFPGTPNPSEAQAVTIGLSEEARNVDFSLVPVRTARISGTVLDSTGEPSRGGSLLLIASRRSGSVATIAVGAHTYPDGRFEFRNVAPGEYVVQVYRGKRSSSIEGEFASQFVAVNGSDVTDLIVQTSTGSIVNGHVILDGGGTIRPRDVELTAVPVDLDLSPGDPAHAEIYNDWTFELLGLNGPRRLRLTRAPKGWALKAIWSHGSDITDTTLPFGTNLQSVKDIEVVLISQSTEVTGTVTDGSRRPIADCIVIVFAVDRERWYWESRFVKSSQPGPDGTFSVQGLPPDEYYIAATDPLTGDDWRDPAFLESIAARATKVSLLEGQKVSANPTLTRNR